jgi:hypothetical protein
MTPGSKEAGSLFCGMIFKLAINQPIPVPEVSLADQVTP